MMDEWQMLLQMQDDLDEYEQNADELFHEAILIEAMADGMSVEEADNFLEHVGRAHEGNIPHSGRYAWGTGENPYQGMIDFKNTVKRLKAAGMSDKDIAKHMGLRNPAHLKAKNSVATNELAKYRRELAVKLKKKGMSNVAIAERIFGDPKKDTTVGNYLKKAESEQKDRLQQVMNAIRDEVKKNHMVAIGEGSELYFKDINVSKSRMKTAIEALKDEGLHSVKLRVPQYQKNNGDMTIVMVLTDFPGTEKQAYRHAYTHAEEIKPFGIRYDDKTEQFHNIEPPRSVSSKRLKVVYAEDGGTKKDGVIEIRRGCEDLDLGRAHYAQVRIAVDGTHYLKGMCLYKDDMPPGVDIIFNTNKHRGTPVMGDKMNSVLKPMDKDPQNPFGATIRKQDELKLVQTHYIGKDGKTYQNCLNIVNEEGNWREWSRTISAQMLSKQPKELVKKQLALTYQERMDQFREIMAISNPVLRKIRLEEFGSACDSASVHLKAHGFSRQMSQVLLPLESLKPNEIYAPNFNDGEEVVLIRYPHASIAEIPSLIVNNKNKEGKAVLGRPVDGVGIPPSVAQHLSGADFDGDTAIVIPNNRHEIRFKEYFDELKEFEPKDAYRGTATSKRMTKPQRSTEMGIITNLITDMTVQDAPAQDLIPAIKHSMVVIDAYKHGLDYKRSELENHIPQLKAKYQTHEDGHIGGVTTLFSKASSTTYIPHRRPKGYDPKTGELKWEQTGEVNRIPKYRTVTKRDEHGKIMRDANGKPIKERVIARDPVTGEVIFKNQARLTKSTQMADTKDARTLISKHNTINERLYAKFANDLKALANQARKEAAAVKMPKKDKNAAEVYRLECQHIMEKLKRAKMNSPLERQAMLLTMAEIRIRKVENNDLTAEEEKKLKNRLFKENRIRVGAHKNAIELTPDEIKAINSNAIAPTVARAVFMNMSAKDRNSLFAPPKESGMTPSLIAKAQRMLDRGVPQSKVAAELGVSVDTLLDNVEIE